MSSDYWKEVLKTAGEKLSELRARSDELDREREKVNIEIMQLEEVMASLSVLVSERTPAPTFYSIAIAQPMSLADACRIILRGCARYMTPIEIRNSLAASHYDLSQHKNPLASIHGVLKRMVDSGEVETIGHDLKGTMYNWRGQPATADEGAKAESWAALVPPARPKTGHRADPTPADSEMPGAISVPPPRRPKTSFTAFGVARKSTKEDKGKKE